MPPEFTDDELLAGAMRALGAEVAIDPWNGVDVDWDGFGAVVIRSTGTTRAGARSPLAWADRVGEPLHNAPSVVRGKPNVPSPLRSGTEERVDPNVAATAFAGQSERRRISGHALPGRPTRP